MIDDAAESRNHAKHIASQHETRVDETKRSVENVRDDVNIARLKNPKPQMMCILN